MHDIERALDAVRQRIAEAESRFGRPAGSVRLVAVSKTQPPESVAIAAAAGQVDFGENQLQDALTKLDELPNPALRWHFIGAVQSNKTRAIAARFDWVQSVDREKIARRLSEQRPLEREPLNVLVQVDTSGEASKSGVSFDGLAALTDALRSMPRLRLRGLMTVPAPAADLDSQRRPFARLRAAFDALNAQGPALDTLSMGMTDDLEAAIAEGATMVRVGTALFGSRRR